MTLLLVTGQRGKTIHLLNLVDMTVFDDQCIFTIPGLLKQNGQVNPILL